MKKPERCSFCGRQESEVKVGLLTGPSGASICRNCVTICDTLFSRNGFPGAKPSSSIPSTTRTKASPPPKSPAVCRRSWTI